MVRSPYWINGKAGSGKSTAVHVRRQALHKRAGNLELETASFLGGRFWGAGSRSWVEDTPPRLTHYCAPGCRLLSSLVQPYPRQLQQPLPQCLQPFKGPTSSFEMPFWCQHFSSARAFLVSAFFLCLMPFFVEMVYEN